MHSLAQEDKRFCPIADKYWNARGGSHTDGGAFVFTIENANGNGSKRLVCTDKFGKVVKIDNNKKHCDMTIQIQQNASENPLKERLADLVENNNALSLFQYIREKIADWDFDTVRLCMKLLGEFAKENDQKKGTVISALTLLHNRHYDTGSKKRSSLLQIIVETLYDIFAATPELWENSDRRYCSIDWNSRKTLRGPDEGEETLIINTSKFPPEGDDCDARLICEAYSMGWKKFIAYGYRGQRFMYGAKGGEVYVLGNAAGRPLINAVGKPRVVINGTCLDYLAESFMAGEPLNGGGFVILNSISFDELGNVKNQPTPYPGGNLFSLASGGAIYMRDPHHQLVEEQLNGGEFAPLADEDWNLILPYLQENERLFGISVDKSLLTVDGVKREPKEVYRKVRAIKLSVLSGEIVPE